MMKKYVVAVRDSAAQAFQSPFIVPATAMGVRAFRDECNRREQGNTMAAHPEDYELWCIGSYDEEKGLLIPEDHVLLVRGKDCVESH